jgi:hypothetical protein
MLDVVLSEQCDQQHGPARFPADADAAVEGYGMVLCLHACLETGGAYGSLFARSDHDDVEINYSVTRRI